MISLMPPKPAPSLKPAVHLFIVVFFFLHFVLIIFSYVRDEEFFGWRMFADARAYQLRLFGVDAQGGKELLTPERYRFWLRDKGRVYFTAAGGERIFARGEKYLIVETRRFARYLCGKLAEYPVIEADLEIRSPGERRPRTVVITASCRERAAP